MSTPISSQHGAKYSVLMVVMVHCALNDTCAKDGHSILSTILEIKSQDETHNCVNQN